MMKAGLFGGAWEDYHDALQKAVADSFRQNLPKRDGGASAEVLLDLEQPQAGAIASNAPSDGPGGPMRAADYTEFAANAAGGKVLPVQPPARPFAKLPQPGETEAGESGGGYRTYGTPGNGEGQYGMPKTMQVITAVSNTLSDPRKTDGYTPLTIGNISLEHGGAWPGGDHHGHKDGLNIDIRPASIQGDGGAVTWQSPNYDRAATQRIIDAFRATGEVANIFFNDPKIQGAAPLAGHDNHLHIRLKP